MYAKIGSAAVSPGDEVEWILTRRKMVASDSSRGGGGQKKFTVSPFFRTPPPLGGVRPEKKYPTPMCKKVSQPQFFSKEHH